MSEPIKTPLGTAPANQPNIPPTEPPVTPPVEPVENPNPEPEPTPEPVTGRRDPLLAALFEDIDPNFKKVEDAPPVEPTVTPPVATPTTTPLPAEPVATSKKKKKKVALIESLDEPAVPIAAPPAPIPEPPVVAPPQQPPADPDASYVAGLGDEQKEELREAEYLERLYPDKYKGRKAALLAWYKNIDTESARLTKENPGRTLNEEDEEFSKVLKTKPKVDNAHSKRVMREIAKDEVQADVRQAMEPKLTELATKQKEMEFQPHLNRMMVAVDGAMDELLAEDEQSPFSAAIKARTAEPPAGTDAKKHREELAEQYALENQIMEDEKKTSGTLTREFVSIVKGVRGYDHNNATHRQLIEFINREGQAMRGQQVEGRTFLPRNEYNQAVERDPTQRDKYITFSNTDILKMIGHQAKINMESRLQTKQDEMKRLGFERRKPASSATPLKPATERPKNELQPITPPKATASAARGPGTQAPAPPNSNSISVSDTLGLRK